MGAKAVGGMLSLTIATLAITWTAGCVQQNQLPRRLVEAQNQVLQLTDENRKLTAELIETRQVVDRQHRQIATLQKMGPQRLEELTRVASIQLDRPTGGYDEDRDGYEDGITVYLQPRDDQGHVIKAAGIARVRLFELQDTPRLIGECTFEPKELRQAWIGRFWTHHYSLRCPFRVSPRIRHITVHVEFTDLLTGGIFVAETLVEIKLPVSATAPASRPGR